ncbi:conserved protein of unknown function [Oenococcus oeni]|uniref:hypothetical protein n=1 Tax=Oenococcus oeni TaxID=1247 RepID=UPI000FD766F3|nr:hypothetical protein [Oenococcus oeni]AZZ60712.1 hypothetical protein DSM07_04950 [Oenococcus sp. UCMA 16435]MDI4583891.1 hypothetical protein [Oenococcus sp. UCMA 14587]MDN6968120.1 hypothetical protein [Oenococcus sp. UCMA 17063]AVI94406.1 hypothetical protein AX764_05995 [Oenococcus oeni]SYW02834.1 conserved hypothetical protein [Oenococcus oeni]
MENPIADYQKIQKNYNQLVSKNYQLPSKTPQDGENVLVDHRPIKITMMVRNQQVTIITIHCSEDGNQAWDEVFEGFEQGMGWSSIKFFNAYQKAVRDRQTVTATAHGIQAVHESKPNNLTVTLTRVGD